VESDFTKLRTIWHGNFALDLARAPRSLVIHGNYLADAERVKPPAQGQQVVGHGSKGARLLPHSLLVREQHLGGRDPAFAQLIDNGFQAFNAGRLSEACHIFSDKMLHPKNDTTIGLTVAGAMTPAGLGGCVIEMMERGLFDFLISTGANLYHDLHYALNFTLHRGSPFLDDRTLFTAGIIRIYDVLFPATVLLETDAYIREFLVRSGISGPVSSSEFHYRLGLDLIKMRPGCEEYSVVARAAKLGVPIYTSSPGDSSIGMNIAWHELMNDSTLMIDPNMGMPAQLMPPTSRLAAFRSRCDSCR
jgi:deoxyhypusine synthase